MTFLDAVMKDAEVRGCYSHHSEWRPREGVDLIAYEKATLDRRDRALIRTTLTLAAERLRAKGAEYHRGGDIELGYTDAADLILTLKESL